MNRDRYHDEGLTLHILPRLVPILYIIRKARTHHELISVGESG